MTTTEEHIAAIRKALEAGPTPGEWVTKQDRERPQIHRVMGESTVVEGLDGICEPDRMNDRTFDESRRNMAYIASCNPVAMTAVLAEIDRLKAENERMLEALEPFADIAGEAWADSDGWTEAACQNNRVVDWFGPSAFHNARAALVSPADTSPVNTSAERVNETPKREHVIPEGWQLVPKVPTNEMTKAALDACPVAPAGVTGKLADYFVMAAEYRAMLAAAPKEASHDD